MEQINLHLRISGKVQGVWYRKSAVQEALRLGVSGYAMNLPDGSVRIEAEGSREDVDRFVEWCRIGPPRAIVERVDATSAPLAGSVGFGIRR